MELMFDQTFAFGDLAVIGLLVILEGVLSIDNALVLGLLAKRLPKTQQGRALTYGLVGAFVFRFIAIATAQYLLKWRFVKLIGGLYLLYVSVKYFLYEFRQESHDEDGAVGEDGQPKSSAIVHAFWPTVLVIELTDIAFAIDSILAAIALVGEDPDRSGLHDKLWVVISGGMLGVVLMRFAAVVFIKLLERFPRFEVSAYLLVAIIGLKLVIDWGSDYVPGGHDYLNFHHWKSPAFWTFWLLMLGSLGFGFTRRKGGAAAVAAPADAEE